MCDLVKGTEDEAFCFLTRFVYGKKKKKIVVCEMQLVLECLNFISKRAS